MNRGIKKRIIIPKGGRKIVEQIDKEVREWTIKEVREAKRKLADDYFTQNIKDPEMSYDPKNWHRSL